LNLLSIVLFAAVDASASADKEAKIAAFQKLQQETKEADQKAAEIRAKYTKFNFLVGRPACVPE
jgi:hypothetical protein